MKSTLSQWVYVGIDHASAALCRLSFRPVNLLGMQKKSIAHLRVGSQIVPIFPYGAFLKTPYNRCAGNKVSESTHRRAVVRPGTRYFVTTFQDTQTQLIIVSSVEVKKRKGIVILSIEFQSMHLKQRVDHQVDFLGNKIL